MSTQPEVPNLLDPFGTWKTMRDASLDIWSKLMIDLVNSEAYSQATGQWLDSYLTLSQPFRHVLEITMTQVLGGLNMPTRAEVTSVAERLTHVEMRLDDLDAKLDDIQRALQALAASKQTADTSANIKEAH